MAKFEEVHATFDGEVLRPDEPVNLKSNAKYKLRIELVDEPSDNGLLRILGLATDLGVSDLAEQHDHYLYGTPKE